MGGMDGVILSSHTRFSVYLFCTTSLYRISLIMVGGAVFYT